MQSWKIPVVYLQNSGEGNIINPVASLLNDQVYAIPVIFIVGWRGDGSAVCVADFNALDKELDAAKKETD